MTQANKMPAPGRGQADTRTTYSEQGNHITAPADVNALLDRLDGVKQLRNGGWVARCPSHGDKSPSLNIRFTGDGTILMHCFAGCGAADVVAAIGLDLKDLFPKRERDDSIKPLSPSQRWVPRDVLVSVAKEATIVAIAAEETAKGKVLSSDDVTRVFEAAGRLRAAAREVGYDYIRERFH